MGGNKYCCRPALLVLFAGVLLQEEIHSKLVLYTSSLLLIAGAYVMM